MFILLISIILFQLNFLFFDMLSFGASFCVRILKFIYFTGCFAFTIPSTASRVSPMAGTIPYRLRSLIHHNHQYIILYPLNVFFILITPLLSFQMYWFWENTLCISLNRVYNQLWVGNQQLLIEYYSWSTKMFAKNRPFKIYPKTLVVRKYLV